MVAIDSLSGRTSVRVSGAALAGGPALVLGPGRRLETLVRGVGGTGGNAFRGLLRQAHAVAGQTAEASGAELASGLEMYPAQWGIPAYFGSAP
ncbi:MAG TPA: hypothetical protein VGW38_08475 [Chloroflexota bacterium]|nr:hypothetical protein [Chloroflexota bacterium]